LVGDWDVEATNSETEEQRYYTIYIQNEDDVEEHFEGDETGEMTELHVDHKTGEFTCSVHFDNRDEEDEVHHMEGHLDGKEAFATVEREDGEWTWHWRPADDKSKKVATRGFKKTKNKTSKFQWKSSFKWNDYDDKENSQLLRAYISGHPVAAMSLRGQHYQYDFKGMEQINKDSGRKRQIRPPYKMKAPSEPIVPPGPTTAVKIPEGAPGETILVPHPQDPSQYIGVEVPEHAEVGTVMLVPVPLLDKKSKKGKGKKTPAKKPDKKSKKGKKDDGMSGGEAVMFAAGGAAMVGGFAVAGAVIGDAVADGALDGVGDVAGDLAADAGDGLADAGEAIMDAMDDIDLDDAGELLMDLGEDAGDLVMDLF